MLNIRKNLFETNSSSVHALVIPKSQSIIIPTTVDLRYCDYGWEDETYGDTIDYIYTACKDRGESWVNKLKKYLKRKGVKKINELGNTDPNMYYGIDHSDEVPLDALFQDEDLMDRFLFGVDSYIQTGNDNVETEEDCPDGINYEDADVIFKYN